MAGFFAKLFGKGKANQSPAEAIESCLEGIIKKGGFDLTYKVKSAGDSFEVELSGSDSKLVTGKEGLLLDAFQMYLKRMLQNKFPTQSIDVVADCDGFLENSAQELKDLAEKLKQVVLERGQPSYVRALPPRERKVVHRYLAEDSRVKSQSIGEGFCKKIKISLDRQKSTRGVSEESAVQEESFV